MRWPLLIDNNVNKQKRYSVYLSQSPEFVSHCYQKEKKQLETEIFRKRKHSKQKRDY